MPSGDASLRILVIEDDPIEYAALFDALGEAGFEVVGATTSKQVRWAFAERAPDLVLLNAHLRSESGVGALVCLRQLPGGQDAPVIAILEAAAPLDLQLQLEQYGAREFLRRPIDAQRVVACVGAATGIDTGAARGARRYPADAELLLAVAGAPAVVRCRVTDVSDDGLFVCLDPPPPPLTRVRIHFRGSDGAERAIDGKVARVVLPEEAYARGSQVGVGIRLALSDRDREGFLDFCQHAVRPDASGRTPEPQGTAPSPLRRPPGPSAAVTVSRTRKVIPRQIRASKDELDLMTQLRNDIRWVRQTSGYEVLGVAEEADEATIDAAAEVAIAELVGQLCEHPHPKVAELAERLARHLEDARARLLEGDAGPPSLVDSTPSSIRYGPTTPPGASVPAPVAAPRGAEGPPLSRPPRSLLPGDERLSEAPLSVPPGAGSVDKAERFYNLAMAALDEGRHRDARNMMQQAFKLEPSREHEAALLLCRAHVARDQDKADMAIGYLKEAFKLDRSPRVRALGIRLQEELEKGKGAFGGLFRR